MAKTTEGFVAKALSGATAMMDPMSETWEANLPVSAVYIWAHNGKPEFQEGVPRFGGFAASAESVIDAVESNDLTIPANWDSLELHGREGAYGAYLARSMIVAPIGFRLRWMNGSTGEYQLTFDRDGGYTRRHVQVLCGLGHIPSETIEQAGYCVLTAKGYQAGRAASPQPSHADGHIVMCGSCNPMQPASRPHDHCGPPAEPARMH